ncbi:MAG TPA: gliding motility lipoprotein GldJ, partial [Flavobacteriales bacterium]|nr:gliding motility lipoprotein GldJ [Flavobacteriales bacterium]
MNWKFIAFGFLASGWILSGCTPERSGATGWAYNDTANGGFERRPYGEQETAPGLVFIEGGTFTMGQIEDDLTSNWDNIPRRVTVPSFYLDETEVTNSFWLEYLHWLNRVYGDT